MNTLTYKGYIGSVNYSDKDQVFFGKIEGIDGLVNFEGESVKELTEAFHEAVDDYLAYSSKSWASRSNKNITLRYMTNKEIKEFSEKLKLGLEIAERRMLEEKALHGEDIIVSSDGETFRRIPAKQLI